MMKRVTLLLISVLGAAPLVLGLNGCAPTETSTATALPERPPTFDELMALADKKLAPDTLIESYIYSQADGVGFQNVMTRAQTGDTTAELMACYLLTAGLGVKEDDPSGYSLCEKAAEKGSGTAISNLIYRDYNASSKDVRWQTAFDAFTDLMEVDPGNAHRGLQFLYSENHPKASRSKVYYHLEESIAHKNTAAMFFLSQYDLGFYRDSKLNPKRAEKNLTEAYNLNDFDAGHKLALQYRNGRVLEKDIPKYAAMTKRMAAFLHPKSMGELGYMYSTGEGAVEDQDKANALFKQSAEFGNPYSQKMIAGHLLFGPMDSRDYETGVRYLENHAQTGDVKAMTTLADHYARPEIEDPKNNHILWRSRAAMMGDMVSKDMFVFSMMDTGYIEVMQPYIQTLERAQRVGNPDASFLLARHYRAASGVARDIPKAQLILGKVAHLNDPRHAEEVEIIESYIEHFGSIEAIPEKVR